MARAFYEAEVMAMAERVACEFQLLRYVPDVVKGEFVNIGVVLRELAVHEAAPGAAVRTEVRFTRDWARVRCLHADADTELLEALEGEIASRLRAGVSAQDPRAVLDTLEDSLSNCVQLTEARATLADSFPSGLEQLLRLYVEPMRVARVRVRSGRAALQLALRTEFEQAGVWGLMRKRIAAAQYTAAGDPLKLDCGYRNGKVRIFQAVSLDGDVEAAKGLAFSAPRLRAGVERVEGAPLELTAVVEPLREVAAEEGELWDRYRFGVDTLEREHVRVITVGDLARAAETARRELRG